VIVGSEEITLAVVAIQQFDVQFAAGEFDPRAQTTLDVVHIRLLKVVRAFWKSPQECWAGNRTNGTFSEI